MRELFRQDATADRAADGTAELVAKRAAFCFSQSEPAPRPHRQCNELCLARSSSRHRVTFTFVTCGTARPGPRPSTVQVKATFGCRKTADVVPSTRQPPSVRCETSRDASTPLLVDSASSRTAATALLHASQARSSGSGSRGSEQATQPNASSAETTGTAQACGRVTTQEFAAMRSSDGIGVRIRTSVAAPGNGRLRSASIPKPNTLAGDTCDTSRLAPLPWEWRSS